MFISNRRKLLETLGKCTAALGLGASLPGTGFSRSEAEAKTAASPVKQGARERGTDFSLAERSKSIAPPGSATKNIKADSMVALLNPRGNPPPITLVPMAPRIGNLDGKTIYIVDVNFPYTEPFYEETRKLLAERYPKTNWVLRKKSGTVFNSDPKLWAEIKEKGHGAIVGPGHMDTMGPAVIGWCLELEKLGVPAAPIIGATYPEIARKVAQDRGMPEMRITYIYHFVARLPGSAYRERMEGKDPLTGTPVLDEIAAALTKPPTAKEMATGTTTRPVSRVLEPDSEENHRRAFLEKGWTDGLPIVLPTEDKVSEMLKGTSHKPDEVVGQMRPSNPHEAWEYTVEKVAVNAVMAGAGPQHFPVILAVASTGITSLWSSVTSFARMIVVNGPIRHQIKMNCDLAALGPFNEANAVIGRSWTLISKNLGGGGGMPGVTYLGTLGNNLNYNNLCFGENEEALPQGWKPFHVQKGFRKEESVVALLSGWTLSVFGAIKPNPRHEIIQRQLTGFETSGPGAHFLPGVNVGGQATLLLSPLVAQELVNEGFDSKEKLSLWLKEHTFMTMWNYWIAYPDNLASAKLGIEPYASMMKLPPEANSPLPLIKSDLPVEIMVVGGETDQPWQAGDFSCMATVSVDKWR